jgi:hypothetical protein
LPSVTLFLRHLLKSSQTSNAPTEIFLCLSLTQYNNYCHELRNTKLIDFFQSQSVQRVPRVRCAVPQRSISGPTLFLLYTGCLKIREFRIQSVVGKDPVELEKYLEKKIALPEEDILQRVHLQTRFFFYFHIWTTGVIPYNALYAEFANFETPCISLN